MLVAMNSKEFIVGSSSPQVNLLLAILCSFGGAVNATAQQYQLMFDEDIYFKQAFKLKKEQVLL